MPCFRYRRNVFSLALILVFTACATAQDAANAPVSVPAGAIPAVQRAETQKPVEVSERQARDADDAYLEGAKEMEHGDLLAAQHSFARAVKLDPNREAYALSLTVAREHYVTELVQQAAIARSQGDNAKANALLVEAHKYDPNNDIVAQHFGPNDRPLPYLQNVPIDYAKLRANLPALDGEVEFAPTPGKKNIHHRGDARDVIREVYEDYGIRVAFDSSYDYGKQVRFDLDDVDFQTATRVLAEMTHEFAVAVQPTTALIAKDTPENRDRLVPLIEETLYMPGIPNEEMTELANLARNVFGLKEVTASSTGGYMLVRGDQNTLRALNATYQDMLDGGSDVLLDIHLYEVDKTHLVNIGANTPSSIGVFSVASTAENLVTANESVLAEAVSTGVLKLTGSFANQQLEKLAFLVGSGIVSSAQFTNLLGTLGTFSGLPLLGVSLGSTGTFDLLLNSSDSRILDQMQLRVGNRQDAEFRAGTRYPIVTATYSSGVSSGLASELAGVSVNGTSAASLLAQYGASTNVTVPQVQYQDLGITLKATPQILRDGSVTMKLDLKIEALAGGTIDMIPILDNRIITSTVTIPTGETALLASSITQNEMRDIAGIPGLSELPGFQGTDKSTEIDSGDLLITITPHIVREQRFHITSRRILMEHTTESAE
jgi:general secretion pathway protein D